MTSSDTDRVTLGRVRQPALARRGKPFVRHVFIGMCLGIISAVSMVVASAVMVRFDRSPKLWVLAADLAALFVAFISILQFYLWRQGVRYWLGKPHGQVRPWIVPSRWGAVLSWVLLFVVPISGVHMARLDVYGGSTFWLTLISSMTAIFAIFLAGRWHFDIDGPPRYPHFPIVRNLPDSGEGSRLSSAIFSAVSRRHRERTQQARNKNKTKNQRFHNTGRYVTRWGRASSRMAVAVVHRIRRKKN